jgi:hypothetical protein
MGLAEYVCDELHWAVRETLRASGEDEVTLVGWCIPAEQGADVAAGYSRDRDAAEAFVARLAHEGLSKPSGASTTAWTCEGRPATVRSSRHCL